METVGDRARRVLAALADLKTLQRGNYAYVILPFDIEFHPQFLKDICRLMVDGWIEMFPREKLKRILTIEAKGLPIAASLSQLLDVPVSIARKRQYNLKGEVAITKTTGYEESTVYINGIHPGARGILLVDDLISTGGTMRPILSWAQDNDIEIPEVWTLFEKRPHASKASAADLLARDFPVKVRRVVSLVQDETLQFGARLSEDLLEER